jgi:hypothetical protein
MIINYLKEECTYKFYEPRGIDITNSLGEYIGTMFSTGKIQLKYNESSTFEYTEHTYIVDPTVLQWIKQRQALNEL